MIGIVEKIQFTHGGLGNQFTTINGECFFTWWDYKDGVKEGVTVEYAVERNATLCSSPHIIGNRATIVRVVVDIPNALNGKPLSQLGHCDYGSHCEVVVVRITDRQVVRQTMVTRQQIPTTHEERLISDVQLAYVAAQSHAETCHHCFSPIVKDAEGNPGFLQDACSIGRVVLQAWLDAEKRYFSKENAQC